MTIPKSIKVIRTTELYMRGFFFYLLSVFGKKKIGVLLFEENKDNGLDRIMTLVLQFNLRGDSKTFSETWEGDQIRSKVTCEK